MTPYKPQPADPLDLAVLFLTLAITTCPDPIRKAMIRLLGAQITSRPQPFDLLRLAMIVVLKREITPRHLQRLEQIVQLLDNALSGSPPQLPPDLLITPGMARWLKSEFDDTLETVPDAHRRPAGVKLLTAGDPPHEIH